VIITTAFLILAMLALILLHRLAQNHAHGEIQKIKQLSLIADRLDLIKRSIDFASGEVVGPQLVDIRTELHIIARKVR
jgi:hypothetical protein